ncbi:pilin/secretion family protein with methylation motif [Hydrogenispora ethanolica]|uniref:Pilin/secretion family protein with methylation motif n=1 Tax=Hydrogenispora ethanolica TaxID=1082276 RepID=A0A4R1RMT5_HYDET|nr:prepilin-type N-terminal cleavage/methylation domain-containing protein [Hydrogenispora ethanolica]TCL67429.1 pilin/secretion family protein with methylation motif [Hydrogenispora ethanolica]
MSTQKNGFTLVEILIAFTITAFLTIAIALMLKNTSNYYSAMRSETEIQQYVQTTLSFCKNEILSAQRFRYTGNSGTTNESITFCNASGQEITYHKEGSILKREKAGETDPIIAENVDVWKITYLNDSQLKFSELSITLKLHDSKDTTISYQNLITIHPRNFEGVLDSDHQGWVK